MTKHSGKENVYKLFKTMLRQTARKPRPWGSEWGAGIADALALLSAPLAGVSAVDRAMVEAASPSAQLRQALARKGVREADLVALSDADVERFAGELLYLAEQRAFEPSRIQGPMVSRHLTALRHGRGVASAAIHKEGWVVGRVAAGVALLSALALATAGIVRRRSQVRSAGQVS